jgi:hypothetical protein
MLKKETGYETLDEYIESLVSLKGMVSVNSERHIHELIELRKELLQSDYKAKLNLEYNTLKLQKQDLTMFNGKSVKKLPSSKKNYDVAVNQIKRELYSLKDGRYKELWVRFRNTKDIVANALAKCNTVAEVEDIIVRFNNYINKLKPYYDNPEAFEEASTLVYSAALSTRKGIEM